MAQGYRSDGFCYATAQEATDAFFSGIPPIIQAGNITLYHRFHKVGDTWHFQKLTYSSTGSSTVNFSVPAPAYTPPLCDNPNDPVANFNDGMTMGWAVAAVMIAVYVIRRVYR